VNSRAEGRKRCCDLGYLRTAYREESGRLGYRCAAEPIDTYVKRGGSVEDTEGRKCLCNGLFANIGHGQVRLDDVDERPIITSGDEIALLSTFFQAHGEYSAGDVIDHLLSLYAGSAEHVDAAANGHGTPGSNGHGPNGNGSNGNGVHHHQGNGNGNGVTIPPQVHSRILA
jgi:hypothetical protein